MTPISVRWAENRSRRAGARSARHRRRLNVPVGAASFAPLLLSVSVAVALSRLIVHGLGSRVLVPVVVSIVVADVATALALRLRINVVLAVGLGWAISLWALALVVDPSLFDPASPHFFHAAELSRQLRAAQSALANDGTPLPSLNGMVGILGAIGGIGAALTRGIWALQWRRSVVAERGPLSPCLAPSLAIFVYTSLVSAEQGRVAAFVSYLVGVLAFVALADRASSRSTRPGAATTAAAGAAPAAAATAPITTAPPVRRYRAGLGALAGCLVVGAVAIAAGAGLSGMRLTVFHVNPPKPGAPKHPTVPGPGVDVSRITGLALVDHLLATEISESHVVIFKAHSPVTTYWQVGTLSSFHGSTWLPTAVVSRALTGSAHAAAASLRSTTLPSPAPQHIFTAKVVIADFVSRLLPAPPTTTAVHGLVGAAVVGQEGVLAPAASTVGTRYTVRAGYDTAVAADAPQLASSDPRLRRYLALPSEPSIVSQLAHQAAGTATTPGAQAQALVNWFRSGRFRYTLSPPATHGANPLVQFLTVTKAGYCEQFAGAYGVLARTLGIPTRLVVGFTPGRPGPDHSFTVTGADAHVWPQVYLGPEAGWVSVEPTPDTPAAAGVLGVGGVVPAQPTPTTIVQVPPTTVPHHHAHHAARHHHGLEWWIPLAVVGGLLVLALVVLWVRRRLRAARDARLPPDQRVVRSWEVALSALRHRGMGQRVEETPGEYAARVRALERDGAQPIEAEAVADLAALVELACYTSRPCTPLQADDSHVLASRIVAANRRHHRRRRSRSDSHEVPV